MEQKIISEAEIIKPELHPTETEESKSQSYKVKIPQKSSALVVVKKGLTNAADYFMPFDYQEIVNVGEAPNRNFDYGVGDIVVFIGR